MIYEQVLQKVISKKSHAISKFIPKENVKAFSQVPITKFLSAGHKVMADMKHASIKKFKIR